MIIIFMDICKYTPKLPPNHVKMIMNDLIIMQKYSDFTYERPPINKQTPLEKPSNIYEYSQKEVNSNIPCRMKTKIIKKCNKEKMDVDREKKALKLYNLYMLQYLNNSAMREVMKKNPLPMSVLDSKDQGDYLPEGDKKDHPHFSNTIKLTQIPNQKSKGFLPQMRKKERVDFEQDDNCVLKIKQFRQFITYLFRLGNEEFEPIAEKIGLNTCTTKLLYDLCNDYFRVENSLDIKNTIVRKKVCRKIIRFAETAFQKYRKDKNMQSYYIPMEEEYLSLKDIRKCLTIALDELSSSESSA